MKAFHCGRLRLPIPPRNRFPVDKYSRLRKKLDTAKELNLEFIESPPVSRNELELAHHRDYVDRVVNGVLSVEEQRLLGFP